MHKYLSSYIPVSLAVAVAIVLGIFDAQTHPVPNFFSEKSLKSMKELNFENQIIIKDLSAPGAGKPFSELLKADVLLPAQPVDRANKGLIVSLDNLNGLFLLQPVKNMSDSELGNVASAYKMAVPEFVNLELDQDINFESIVYDWNIFQEESANEPTLSLSSEEDNEPVKVAVIDSGVETDHEIFASTVVGIGWNTITQDDTMYDDVGHGTHIAGIIAMNAPNAEIYPYKIVDSKGGRLSNVLEAFSKAISDDVDIINTSFGVSSSSYALEGIVEKAYENGIMVVSAAGNSGSDTGFYPAYYDYTIAVAGVDAAEHKMPNSNFGDWVDVAAYGYHVRSSIPENRYGYKSGTSQATAFVSAAVANLLAGSSTDMSFDDVLLALKASPEQIPDGELAGIPVITTGE